MCLFAYGFTKSHIGPTSSTSSLPTLTYLAGKRELGLGREEHDAVTVSVQIMPIQTHIQKSPRILEVNTPSTLISKEPQLGNMPAKMA